MPLVCMGFVSPGDLTYALRTMDTRRCIGASHWTPCQQLHAGMLQTTSAVAGLLAQTACTTTGHAQQQPHCKGSLQPTCSGEGCCRPHSRPPTSC